MKLQLFVVMREVIGVLNVFMFVILFMTDLVCIHFRVCDRVLSVNVSVNNHCDYVRDIGSIFVCMTVIMIVSNFDRFLIHFLFIVFVLQPVLYL